MSYCSCDNSHQESRIFGRKIEVEHHDKEEEYNDSRRLLVNDIPIDECTDHSSKRCSTISKQIEHGASRTRAHANCDHNKCPNNALPDEEGPRFFQISHYTNTHHRHRDSSAELHWIRTQKF